MNIIRRASKSGPGINRREFLRRGVCAGFTMAGVFSTMSTLRLFEAQLAAQGMAPGNDYKSLVCLFLFGGNDSNNMLVPYEPADYNAYAASRDVLAIPREDLLPIADPNSDGRQFGLHPGLGPIQAIYNAGKCAFVANVGTLLAPITKAEFQAGGSAIPPFLFSHNDQQVQWQASVPDSPKKIGWGGKIADLKQALYNTSAVSMNISVAGNNFFQIGEDVFQYQMGTDGPTGLHPWGTERVLAKPVLNSLFSHDYDNLFEQEYAAVTRRAMDNEALVSGELSHVQWFYQTGDEEIDAGADPARWYFTPGPRGVSSLQAQLNMILRMISLREELGMRRQIFFCSIGGFDTHDDQVNDQDVLLRALSQAVGEFYNGLVGEGLVDDVTLFTASDFNRTFSSNGKGSDHAWGSHQFVLGGRVNGGRVYGRMPILTANGPDDSGSRGAWIPTTSVDEYSATLARWFGVEPGEMAYVLPNIGRFAHPDLGFML
jgi:uncharacterized protein (DUF1501 family)